MTIVVNFSFSQSISPIELDVRLSFKMVLKERKGGEEGGENGKGKGKHKIRRTRRYRFTTSDPPILLFINKECQDLQSLGFQFCNRLPSQSQTASENGPNIYRRNRDTGVYRISLSLVTKEGEEYCCDQNSTSEVGVLKQIPINGWVSGVEVYVSVISNPEVVCLKPIVFVTQVS